MPVGITFQSGLLRWLRRAPVFGAVTIAICWFASLFFEFSCGWSDAEPGDHYAWLKNGSLEFASVYSRCGGGGSHTRGHFWKNTLIMWNWPPESLGFVLPSSIRDPLAPALRDRKLESYVLPLWIPLLACATPAGLLWLRDSRRIAPGCCTRCGYDLTGNLSGRCPECGAAAG
jgi:hypothetical protein